MQAGFVLGTFKVCASKLVDSPIIPPNEAADGTLEKVRYYHESPILRIRSTVKVLRREFRESCCVAIIARICGANNIYWDQNTAANDTEHDENVPDHPGNPHEQNSI